MLCCIKRFEKLVKVMMSSLGNRGLGVALLHRISVLHTNWNNRRFMILGATLETILTVGLG